MNQEVMNIFNPAQEGPTFDRIKISLASPEKILSWSFGEIRKPETINASAVSVWAISNWPLLARISGS